MTKDTKEMETTDVTTFITSNLPKILSELSNSTYTYVLKDSYNPVSGITYWVIDPVSGSHGIYLNSECIGGEKVI